LTEEVCKRVEQSKQTNLYKQRNIPEMANGDAFVFTLTPAQCKQLIMQAYSVAE